jgi:hypothetical protein
MKIDKDEVSNYLKKYNNHMSDCFDLIYNEVYENFKDNNNDIDPDLHDKILKDTINTLFFQINK